MGRLGPVLSDVAADGRVLTVQPGGNHGDTLVYSGFDKLIGGTGVRTVPFAEGRARFDRPPHMPSALVRDYPKWVSVHLRHLYHRVASHCDAVYIHGGGNFNDLWYSGVRCYTTAARYFDCPIVVGPQSVYFDRTDPEALFARVDNETHFFCREEYSYDIMRAATDRFDHVSVHLDDDTALYLDAEDLPHAASPDEYTLVAMRGDKDSRAPLIAEDVPGPVRVRDISVMEDSYEAWVDAVARAETVYTDRLHVAILGSILGKPVTWYDSGYHKNRGVYEYSLSDRLGIDFRYDGSAP